jgi:hypothetical protein
MSKYKKPKIFYNDKTIEFVLNALGYGIINNNEVVINRNNGYMIYKKNGETLKAHEIVGIHKDYGFITKNDIVHIASNGSVLLKEIK